MTRISISCRHILKRLRFRKIESRIKRREESWLYFAVSIGRLRWWLVVPPYVYTTVVWSQYGRRSKWTNYLSRTCIDYLICLSIGMRSTPWTHLRTNAILFDPIALKIGQSQATAPSALPRSLSPAFTCWTIVWRLFARALLGGHSLRGLT